MKRVNIEQTFTPGEMSGPEFATRIMNAADTSGDRVFTCSNGDGPTLVFYSEPPETEVNPYVEPGWPPDPDDVSGMQLFCPKCGYELKRMKSSKRLRLSGSTITDEYFRCWRCSAVVSDNDVRKRRRASKRTKFRLTALEWLTIFAAVALIGNLIYG